MAQCPQCGTEYTASEQQLSCPRCGAQAELDMAAEHPQTMPIRRTPRLTMVLIGINVIVFLAMVVVSRSLMSLNIDLLLAWGANYGPLTLSGQWWRIEASTFLHGGLLHLLFNMWALLNLGLLAEIIFGAGNFLALYFLAGVGGGIASLWWHPNVVGVGASGAIFGLAGALLPALFFEKNDRLRRAMRGNLGSIAIFVIYSIGYGATSQRIDNAAHFGGLVSGLALGFLLPKATNGPVNRMRSFVVIVALAALLIGGAIFTRNQNRNVLAFAEAEKLAQKGDTDGAIVAAEKLVAQHPEMMEAHDLLANLYLDNRQPEQAIAELEIVLKQRPEYAYGQTRYCVALLRARRMGQALPACKEAVRLDPHNPDLQFNLGLTYRAARDTANAEDAFSKAAQLRPDSAEENYFYGIALLENNKFQKAAQQFEKVLKLDPHYAGAEAALHEAQQHLGQ